MAFDLDRIDWSPAVPQVRPDNVTVRDGESVIELWLPQAYDMELSFPAHGGGVGKEWLELAADVLAHLTGMDNAVQRASAERWAGSPYPASYYEGDLWRVALPGPDEAVLHYTARGCNSEWDERFVRAGGRWVRVADAAPGSAAHTALR